MIGCGPTSGLAHAAVREVCGRRLLPLLLGCALAWGIPTGRAAASAEPVRLGRPGFLIIAAARDTAGAFVWSAGPGPQSRSLTWADGQLVIPDTLPVLDFGRLDLGVTVVADLQGSGSGGVLAFVDGVYPIDEPLMLTDGVVTLMAAAGQLEIRGPQLRYLAPRRAAGPAEERRDPRAGYVFLTGMLLLVLVLLRRARMVSKRGAAR